MTKLVKNYIGLLNSEWKYKYHNVPNTPYCVETFWNSNVSIDICFIRGSIPDRRRERFVSAFVHDDEIEIRSLKALSEWVDKQTKEKEQ